MKWLLYTLTTLVAVVFFPLCKHQPLYKVDQLPSQQLRWGRGGGIVGKETTHTLLKNGQLFDRDMEGVLHETKSAKSKVAARLFQKATALEFAKLDFSHPSNIYSFIEWQDGDAVARITWGDPAYPVAPDILALFNQLNGLLKQ